VLQAKSFMTASEMGLALYTSLQGEAEAEAEHLDLKRINDKNGVNYILEELRGPLQQKVLFQKRKLLADFEGVRRHGNETVRQYVNRYRRIERDLQAVGIETSTMYDIEARGNRILERCQLSPDLQRLVMIGAGNSLDYAKITESMCLQFPDFKPTPPIWITGGIRQAPQQASASSSSSSSYLKALRGHLGLRRHQLHLERAVSQEKGTRQRRIPTARALLVASSKRNTKLEKMKSQMMLKMMNLKIRRNPMRMTRSWNQSLKATKPPTVTAMNL
jgi:hypothetical protein